MQILYIEDNSNDAQLIRLYADAVGSQLKVVNNLDAFWNTDPLQFDLVLVDILLQFTREGLEVPARLRDQGYTNPIIAVTALSTPADRMQCEEAGFTRILTKPFTIDQLQAILNQEPS
jgi:DNA-binding response OmpR family regulator